MAARLLRCTSLWGTSDWIAADPALRRLPEAIYRPWSAEAPWGLFAEGRSIGDGATEAGLAAAETAAKRQFLYVGALATHYGHFLINTLPRLWPLVSWQGPLPRILCHVPGPREAWEELPFLGAILGRLGLDMADVVTFDRPTTLRDIVVPEPALQEQAAVHAVFADLCRTIGQPLWQDVAVDGLRRPLYLSKTRMRSGVAHVANEDAILAELERRGVEIAFPETLAFADQVRLLSGRRIVMGTLGSAFHTAAFAAPGRRLVGLNWQHAVNANFALLDRVNGATARYYHPHGTLYEEGSDWHLAWTVADPRGVAAALLRRAEWLDRGEPDDAGVVAEVRRRVLRPFRRG
ncbi:glycosyltransferase family 61 protein [Methylobacterium haplocladii]|uniref:Glycosyltransferase 61 catalytic domain-containing protein n=1 Tax=Methylobacterium haplocladii TaxID=1176176 RepID=A0A512IPG5_9HYPH|nr:glycosyltransferase family 61 protein [Methylobacterium haplocladii]GEO99601.1 hypothetical protein MHA02_19890 [Methylobacterium haplocladii]GJD85892.1 hypothetical protein HPGCJGGD_3787 [Methylobacterium haplocladii]GLS58577.1 hypothetical protein GCM10007887_12410 [Methylobacterium haplocladii]